MLIEAVLNAFSILGICLHPDFGKYLSLEFCCFLSKRVQGQAFEGRSWEDLFDLAQGWVDGSGLADATKNASNNTSETDVAPKSISGWDGLDCLQVG